MVFQKLKEGYKIQLFWTVESNHFLGREFRKVIRQKIKESFFSVLPIFLIVLVLSAVVTPVPSGTLLCFLAGTVLLILGNAIFGIGAEFAMTPIGEKIGKEITKSRSILLVIVAGFLLGFAVTIAEPDLKVLATQVPSIPENLLIYGVACGVGLFLVIALLRMFFTVPLKSLLVILYTLVLIAAFYVPEGYQAISFDAGGVTTGPMTVPFIMALGVGVAAIRNDKKAVDDSFGLVALCSIGPIITVMVLGMLPITGTSPELASTASIEYVSTAQETVGLSVPDVENSIELFKLYADGFPVYLKEMISALLPIVLAFFFFQIVSLKLKSFAFLKIVSGLLYTYVGLVIFMTGVNLGFLPMGYYLGNLIVTGDSPWLLVPVSMLMGFVCVKAEPAVAVLNRQVEEMTDGSVSARLMGTSLSIGVGISLGLSMLRVLTGISILWFVIPGYAIAILVSFLVPDLYTAIAFDSGGVASGPMTAAFLLPMAEGACQGAGGNVATDAFGVVALVAMTPLITIQVLGLLTRGKRKIELHPVTNVLELDDRSIIEL